MQGCLMTLLEKKVWRFLILHKTKSQFCYKVYQGWRLIRFDYFLKVCILNAGSTYLHPNPATWLFTLVSITSNRYSAILQCNWSVANFCCSGSQHYIPCILTLCTPINFDTDFPQLLFKNGTYPIMQIKQANKQN